MNLAFLVIAFVSPLLLGIAGYGGHCKRFVQVFTFLGAGSVALKYGFNSANTDNNSYFA